MTNQNAMPVVDLNGTFGSTFVGVLSASVLYGTSCAQTAWYLRKYQQDPPCLRSLVTVLWVLDTGRIAMSSKVLWYWLVENHAICAGLVHVPRTFLAEFLLAALIVFTVQCYYIMLIWRLSEDRWCRKPLAIIALLLATMSFGAAIAVIYRATTDTTLAVTIPAVIIPACIQTAAAAAADIYIALFLCCILYGQRTGPGKTRTLLSQLISYAVYRGFLTTLVQTSFLVTYVMTIHRATLYWMLAHMPGSGVYVNSLLALLNVRHHLRDRIMADVDSDISLPMEFLSTRSRLQEWAGASSNESGS